MTFPEYAPALYMLVIFLILWTWHRSISQEPAQSRDGTSYFYRNFLDSLLRRLRDLVSRTSNNRSPNVSTTDESDDSPSDPEPPGQATVGRGSETQSGVSHLLLEFWRMLKTLFRRNEEDSQLSDETEIPQEDTESNETQQFTEHATPSTYDPFTLANYETDTPALRMERDTGSTLDPIASGEEAEKETTELHEDAQTLLNSTEENSARGNNQTTPRSVIDSGSKIGIKPLEKSDDHEIKRKSEHDADVVSEAKVVLNMQINGYRWQQGTRIILTFEQEDLAIGVFKAQGENPCTLESPKCPARDQQDTIKNSTNHHLPPDPDVVQKHNAPTLSAS